MRMNKGFSTYYIYRRMQNNGGTPGKNLFAEKILLSDYDSTIILNFARDCVKNALKTA